MQVLCKLLRWGAIEMPRRILQDASFKLRDVLALRGHLMLGILKILLKQARLSIKSRPRPSAKAVGTRNEG